MKKFLAAMVVVVALGAGCSGSGEGTVSTGGETGSTSAQGATFVVNGHVFTLPDASWRAVVQDEDSSRVNIFTKNGKMILSMGITMDEPTGSATFNITGGDLYKTECASPMVCYMYWDKADDGVWNIKVDPEDETIATEAELTALLKSITRNN